MGAPRSLGAIAAELGERIDATLLDQSQWQELADFLYQAFPGTKVVINVEDATGLGNVGVLTCGFDPKLLVQYAERYSKLNPWVPFWSRYPALKAAVADETLPSASFSETEFYRDFIVPEREIESAAGIKLAHESNRLGMLSIHYGTRLAPRYNVDIPRVLKASAVKLRRALDLGRIAAMNCAAQRAFEVASQFELPALVLDECARVLGQNAAGDALLRDATLLRLNRDRALIASDASTTVRIIEIAASIARREGTWRDGWDVKTSCKDGHPYALSFYPLTTRTSEMLALPTFLLPKRVALLVIRGIEHEETEQRTTLWRSLGLTPAERRLADELCAGYSLQSSADHLGVAYATARNQLKAIFAKTGVHRQAELVALLARPLDGARRRPRA